MTHAVHHVTMRYRLPQTKPSVCPVTAKDLPAVRRRGGQHAGATHRLRAALRRLFAERGAA